MISPLSNARSPGYVGSKVCNARTRVTTEFAACGAGWATGSGVAMVGAAVAVAAENEGGGWALGEGVRAGTYPAWYFGAAKLLAGRDEELL